MKKTMITLFTLAFGGKVAAGGLPDDPVLFKLMIDRAEVSDPDGNSAFSWEAEAWLGKDLHKLWIKTEGERSAEEGTEEGSLELLYSRAVAPYWDFQAGWRRDFEPAGRDWLALGFKGLAPYLFEVDATAYLGESGRMALGLQAEYEYLFTQRLILTPETELKLYSRDDEAMGVGSGLSNLSFGLRLRYELRREFAPYIGVTWWRKFGNSADYAEAEGGRRTDTRFVVGIRAWF